MNEMNMSFDADKDKLVPGVGGYSHDNFFSLENESLFPHNQSDDNLSGRFNENETGHNILHSSENGNSVESNQRKGNFNKGEISNLNDIILIPLFTNKNTSITFKETKSTDLVSQKTKTKPLFHTNIEISKKPEVIEDIKDETPKYFPENSINVIIRQFNISKELKSNFLFDNKMKNSELEKIKEVLKSNTIRRRKQSKDNGYRTDNILSQLINIFNLFLLQFINNLINVIYSKEEINQILSGLNLQYKISAHDLKQVIKKNDYKYRYNLKKVDDIKKLLKLSLEDYFSSEISRKYDKSKYPNNYNQLIIKKLLEDETNKDIFQFILKDLTVMDWLDIFLYKINLCDIDKFNSFHQKNKIIKSLKGIDHYIDKIMNKKDKIYFQKFALVSYNLKRFLHLKEKRKIYKKIKRRK